MKRILLALSFAVAPFVASGHDVAKGPNGGPLVQVADRHVEMVANGTEFVLFVTDAGHAPLASAGATARAIVQDGGKTATLPLQPADPNKLVGTLGQPLGKGARVVVSATLADGKAVQARFVNN